VVWQHKGSVLCFLHNGCDTERVNGPCAPQPALQQGLLDSLETKCIRSFWLLVMR